MPQKSGLSLFYILGDQSGENLKSARKQTQRVVHLQRPYGRFGCGSARHDHSRFPVENEVKMPTQEPRLEMARIEKQISGSIPLSTLRAKIDYGFHEAMTPQGHIGIQVWVNQGMYEGDSDGADAEEGQAPKKPKRTYKR